MLLLEDFAILLIVKNPYLLPGIHNGLSFNLIMLLLEDFAILLIVKNPYWLRHNKANLCCFIFYKI